MNTKRIVLAGLLVPFMFAGCLMVPGPRGEGVLLVPPLPALVVLGAEPYYYHSGYHYYYRDNGWSYARSRRGPWLNLPRDHYPSEVRFNDGGAGKGRGSSHPGRREEEHGRQER